MKNFYTYHNEPLFGAFSHPFCFDKKLQKEFQVAYNNPFDSLIEQVIKLDVESIRRIFISNFLYKF